MGRSHRATNGTGLHQHHRPAGSSAAYMCAAPLPGEGWPCRDEQRCWWGRPTESDHLWGSFLFIDRSPRPHSLCVSHLYDLVVALDNVQQVLLFVFQPERNTVSTSGFFSIFTPFLLLLCQCWVGWFVFFFSIKYKITLVVLLCCSPSTFFFFFFWENIAVFQSVTKVRSYSPLAPQQPVEHPGLCSRVCQSLCKQQKAMAEGELVPLFRCGQGAWVWMMVKQSQWPSFLPRGYVHLLWRSLSLQTITAGRLPTWVFLFSVVTMNIHPPHDLSSACV